MLQFGIVSISCENCYPVRGEKWCGICEVNSTLQGYSTGMLMRNFLFRTTVIDRLAHSKLQRLLFIQYRFVYSNRSVDQFPAEAEGAVSYPTPHRMSAA